MNKQLQQDIEKQVGGLYSMNAPYAIGYLYTIAKDGTEVSTGMFASSLDEVDPDRWDGFYHINEKKFYQDNEFNQLK